MRPIFYQLEGQQIQFISFSLPCLFGWSAQSDSTWMLRVIRLFATQPNTNTKTINTNTQTIDTNTQTIDTNTNGRVISVTQHGCCESFCFLRRNGTQIQIQLIQIQKRLIQIQK